MTFGDLWTAPIAVPLPVVLAGGAGAVVATAAALSAQAAHRQQLPARRWSRPLPAVLRRGVDARPVRVALRLVGLVAGTWGIVALARHDAPVDGAAAIAALTTASVVAGPVHRLVDPIRAFPAARRNAGVQRSVRAAVGWLIALCAIALTTHDPQFLAATAAGYVVLRLVQAWRGHGVHGDPVGVLATLLAPLAPVGRGRDGAVSWRNPMVAVAHAALPPGAVGAVAAVIAATLTHAARQHPVWRATLEDPAATVLLFGVALVVVAAVLGMALIRPFLRSATVPLAAAYGVMAGGRWLPPVDLVVFVALHVVAVGVLHRQVLARYDLRTARAVQFPLRLVLVLSVITGLALLIER